MSPKCAKKVTVVLTPLEAEALKRAADEMWDDIWISGWEMQKGKAYYRAMRKLAAVIYNPEASR